MLRKAAKMHEQNAPQLGGVERNCIAQWSAIWEAQLRFLVAVAGDRQRPG
jgi:hypothetical protein